MRPDLWVVAVHDADRERELAPAGTDEQAHARPLSAVSDDHARPDSHDGTVGQDDRFGADAKPFDSATFEGFDLVINATPLGTLGARESETAATADQLRGVRVAYDLVYNPSETRFMREAREAGCASVVGGLAMLVAQAAAQFELWTGERAPFEVMREAALKKLAGGS